MKLTNEKCSCSLSMRSWPVLLAVGLLVTFLPGAAAAKGLFVCSEHHTNQFDAWSISAGGTITKQWTYTGIQATDPAGIAIDAVDPHTGTIIFITSEFSSGVEIIEVPPVGNPVSLGVSSGPSNLAGVDVDDVDNIVYSVRRSTNDLYIFSWDTVSETLTQLALVDLPNCGQAFGLSLDDSSDILWVADSSSGVARAYDVSNLGAIVEIPTLSFTPSHKPIDISVDLTRDFVYTVSIIGGAAVPGGTGSNLLSKYDLTTKVETTVNMGHAGVGVAVDDVTGLVYVTGGAYVGDNISVWDTSTSPFTEVQDTGDIGNPAGLAIANVIVNPLNLAKNDDIVGQVYIGSTFTYDITCDNLNNNFDVTNVKIIDTLPVELDFVSATHGGIYDPITHTVLWDIGTIPAGGTGPQIDLVVKVNNNAIPGSIVYNYAHIEADQVPPTDVIDDEDTEDPDDDGTPIAENQPPTAYAGDYEPFEQTSYAGAEVTLDGSGSTDDGVIQTLTYTWTWDGGSAEGVNPTVTLPLGTTTVTLTVDDGEFTDSDTVDITVEDTTDPVVTILSVNPEELWSPNHKMIPVIVLIEAEDICTETDELEVSVTVTSNEPDDDKGDGAFTGDVDGYDGFTAPVPVICVFDEEAGCFVGSFALRAERDGRADGRAYTIEAVCEDASGNSATATETVEVTVPHDRGKGKK